MNALFDRTAAHSACRIAICLACVMGTGRAAAAFAAEPGEPATPSAPAPSSPEQPATPAAAAETPATAPTAIVAAEAPAAKTPSLASRFTGSSLTYRNAAVARSLDKSADPTWNPTYSMSLVFGPRFAITDRWYLSGFSILSREITQDDSTTRNGELVYSDTTLTTGYKVFVDKELGLSVATDFHAILPTSKSSIARTLQLGTGLGLSINFSKGPFSVTAISRAAGLWHKYATGSLEKPWLANCSALGSGCDAFEQSGVRNPNYRFSEIGALSYHPLDWLGVSVTGGAFIDKLYALSSTTTAGGQTAAVDPTDASTRYTMFYVIGVDAQVHKAVNVSVGTQTFNPLLRPDSTYDTPFINRYTSVYLDIAISPEKLF